MIPEQQIDAVVFDMDGVLIDSHPAHYAAWKQFLLCEGVAVRDAELDFILEGRTRNEILRHFLGDLSDDQVRELGRRKDEIFRKLEHHIVPVAGVLEFIRELSERKIARAVATSASEIRTFATLERMGLGGCFDAVVTAADVLVGKPDPAVYQLACERMNLNPRNVLAFDDACAGVVAATSAGVRCIGVSSNGLRERLLLSGAERVIPDFAGLAFDSVAASQVGVAGPEAPAQSR